MDLQVITIIMFNGEPVQITGGDSPEEAIRTLGKAIKLIKSNEVAHQAVEEE